jgi:hypothetical protein
VEVLVEYLQEEEQWNVQKLADKNLDLLYIVGFGIVALAENLE